MAEEWETLCRPPPFDGSEEAWPDWAFVARAHLPVLAPEVATFKEAAELQSEIDDGILITRERILVTALGQAGVEASKKTDYALVLAVQGAASTVIGSQQA